MFTNELKICIWWDSLEHIYIIYF